MGFWLFFWPRVWPCTLLDSLCWIHLIPQCWPPKQKIIHLIWQQRWDRALQWRNWDDGSNWLKHIRLDWQGIHRLSQASLKVLLQKHDAVFQEGLGTLQGHELAIVVDPQAAPCFSKARPASYAMWPKVEVELKWLVEEDTLEPVQFSEWASPIVAAVKSDECLHLRLF